MSSDPLAGVWFSSPVMGLPQRRKVDLLEVHISEEIFLATFASVGPIKMDERTRRDSREILLWPCIPASIRMIMKWVIRWQEILDNPKKLMNGIVVFLVYPHCFLSTRCVIFVGIQLVSKSAVYCLVSTGKWQLTRLDLPAPDLETPVG